MTKLTFPQRNRFQLPVICFISLVAISSSPAAEFIPLGFLPGDDISGVLSVSDDGTIVVGRSRNSAESFAGEAFLWTAGTGMVGLGVLSGDTSSNAFGISGDGSTIVGESRMFPPNVWEAMIYTGVEGMRGLGNRGENAGTGSIARAASFNGSVVVGAASIDGIVEAFRWTEEAGIVGLGLLPGYEEWDGFSSRATDVSADGTVIVGTSSWSNFDGSSRLRNFRWTAETGIVDLGVPRWDAGPSPQVSSDGSVITGTAFVTSDEFAEAYRWTEEAGVVGLGWPSGVGQVHSEGISMNIDGSVIVGSYRANGDRAKPFIWTAESGMQDLHQLLINEYGLETELAGWTLFPRDISANGQLIAGFGDNPDGARESWLLRLDAPIPEPSTGLLAVVGSLLLARTRCRRRR